LVEAVEPRKGKKERLLAYIVDVAGAEYRASNGPDRGKMALVEFLEGVVTSLRCSGK
jgi:hypothetical protein